MGIEPTVFRLEGERVIHCATGLTDRYFLIFRSVQFWVFLAPKPRAFIDQLTNEWPNHLTMFSLGLRITPYPFGQNSEYCE